MRSIIHFGIEAFFAIIESQRRPDLSGKPVVVISSTGATGGVVVSASSEAKLLGVEESMTMRHARRIAPHAAFIQADFALYRQASAAVMDVFTRYCPLVEPESLDRVWLDVSGSRDLFGGPRKIAADATGKIEAMGYSIKAGIAANKLIARIASSAAAPGKTVLVRPGDEKAFLARSAVDVLPGIGEKTRKRLFDLGIKTVGQLAIIPENLLVRQFGAVGERLHRLSQGIDHDPVHPIWPPEIINIEHMFDAASAEPALEQHLRLIAEHLAIKLRGQSRLAATVMLEMHSAGSGQTCRMLWRLKQPSDQAVEIQTALQRLLALTQPGSEIAGVSVTLSDLTLGEGLQLSLLGPSERKRRLDKLMAAVHRRFGEGSIIYASSLMLRRGVRT